MDTPSPGAVRPATGSGVPLAFLDGLQQRVGAAGLPAAGRDPALAMVLGEHATAVSDWLARNGLAGNRTALGGYGEAVLIAAQRCGRVLPRDPAGLDWSRAEWYLLRLLAVCALAHEPAWR